MTMSEMEAESIPLDSTEPMASLPGWGRGRRVAMPSTDNPDPMEPASTSTRAPGDEGAGGGSSEPTSASIRALFKGRAKSYAKIAETLFQALGGWANAVTAHGLDTEAWLPDDDDMETVPPPLGRIAARRIKIGADPEQLSDIEDMGMAAVGLLVWAAKGIGALFEARREARRLLAGRAVHNETGDGQ